MRKKLSLVLSGLSAAAALAASSAALGATEFYAGLERFEWTENAPGGAQLLKESGPRYVLGADWSAERESGLLFGLRSRAFFGVVDYDGQTWGGAPAATDTVYLGADVQGRAGWRVPAGNVRAAVFAALGYRAWVRDIESTDVAQGYSEVWRMPYAGVGISASQESGRGLYGEAFAGVPFSVRNKAYLTDAGADGDVTLKPDGKLLLSLEAGYRFDAWTLSGYYSQTRFGASGVETASFGGTPVGVFQPESKEEAYGVRLGYRF